VNVNQIHVFTSSSAVTERPVLQGVSVLAEIHYVPEKVIPSKKWYRDTICGFTALHYSLRHYTQTLSLQLNTFVGL